MSYKRLTERTKHGIAVLDSGERFVLSCGGYATTKALNRLAELEDKIENGTLVELPCKVGDIVYVVNSNDEIEKAVLDNYEVNKLGYTLTIISKTTKGEYYLFDFDFNKDWFLTKAEAEKKLEELKGGAK